MGLLRWDIQISHARLEETYQERSEIWEATILSQRDIIANHLRLNKPDNLEQGPTATSGIPNGYRLQNDMLHLIEAKRAELLALDNEGNTSEPGNAQNMTPEAVDLDSQSEDASVAEGIPGEDQGEFLHTTTTAWCVEVCSAEGERPLNFQLGKLEEFSDGSKLIGSETHISFAVSQHQCVCL
jgi:hypothetical protein